MRRSTRLLLIAWFVALLALPGVATIFTSRDTIANREPTPFPSVDVGEMLDGPFFGDVDGFVEDRLSIREWAIETDAAVSYEVFNDAPNSQVYVGDDGFLFLAATYDTPCQGQQLGRWPAPDVVAERLEGLRAALANNGADFFFTVVPEKGWIYPERLPGAVENLDCAEQLITQLRDRVTAEPGYIDLFTLFEAQSVVDPDTLYQRTDTHWTNYGRTIATEAIVDAIVPGTYDRELLEYQAEVAKPEGGDLARLMGYGVADSDVRIETVRPGVTTQSIEAPGSQRKWRSTTTSTAAPLLPGRTVIMTDSHLNTTATQLAHWFEELHIVPFQETNSENVAALVHDADRVIMAYSARFSAERLSSFSQILARNLTES